MKSPAAAPVKADKIRGVAEFPVKRQCRNSSEALLTLSGSGVSNGTTSTPSLALNVHVLVPTTVYVQINNVGTSAIADGFS